MSNLTQGKQTAVIMAKNGGDENVFIHAHAMTGRWRVFVN